MREKVGSKWNRDGAFPRAAGDAMGSALEPSVSAAGNERAVRHRGAQRPVAKPAPVIDRILTRRVLRDLFGSLYAVLLFPLLLVCTAVVSG